jgi:hypothetical protein
MSQNSRPTEDISNSGWTPMTGYYRMINEATPDDAASVVVSGLNPQGSFFEVLLADLAWPDNRVSNIYTLTVRLQKTGSDNVPVTIALVQGITIIGATVVQPTTAFGNYGFQLTPAQIQAITNYTDLRLRVTAGITTQNCPFCQSNSACSSYLASFSGFTGSLSYLNGASLALPYLNLATGAFQACAYGTYDSYGYFYSLALCSSNDNTKFWIQFQIFAPPSLSQVYFASNPPNCGSSSFSGFANGFNSPPNCLIPVTLTPGDSGVLGGPFTGSVLITTS